MALQLRRGTNQQRLGLTPVEGEMIYVTDNVLVTISVTSIDTGTETLSTSVEHGLILNQQVKYIGATLNGLTKDQVYFVKTTPTTTSFTLSTSSGGGTLNITGTYSVPLVFAKTPCNASGAPLGYDVSPLWAGDGTTVGGNPAGAILLDELRDVVITAPAVEGEFLWYNGTNWVNENETTVDTRAKTLSLTRRSDSTGENYENEVTLRLNDRLTDNNSYATDEGGPAVSYERSSGTEYTKTYVSGGAIGAYTVTLNNVTNLVIGHRVDGTGLTRENPGALITNISGNQITLDKAFTVQASGSYTIGAPISFGHVAMEWYGSTNLHKFKVATSTDGFLENPANTYPGTNVLIESTKNGTIINSALYIDGVNDRIGINDAGPDYDITVYKSVNPNFALINADREFLLTNDANNDQLSFAWGGSNRLQFNIPNSDQSFPTGRLGVATASPNYTLDVNGTANVETSLTVPSISTLTGDDLTIAPISGRDITISTTAAAEPVTIARNSASTNSAIRALTIRANSTGTPAVGFGNTLEFQVENASNANKAAGYIAITSTNITAGSETFDMNFGLMDAGAAYNNKMSLSSTGNLQIDGDLSVSGGNINAGADDIILTIERTTTGTSGLFRRALILNSPTTGTPSVGYGTAMSFTGQTSASNFEDAGFIAVTSTDNTGGSEDFKMTFGLMQNGAAYADKMALDSTGYLTANSASFGVIDINTTTGQIDTNSGYDLTLDSDGGDVFVNDRLTVEVTLQTPSREDVANGAAMSIGSASSFFSTGGTGETSTLGAGNEGQFKSLAMKAHGGGNMVVTVTNAGWKTSGTGTITFGNIGDACLLQYIDGKWFAVGANDVIFA